MPGILVPIISVVTIFGILPGIIFNFVYKMKKLKLEEKELLVRSEQLRLEIERDRQKIALLEVEGRP